MKRSINGDIPSSHVTTCRIRFSPVVLTRKPPPIASLLASCLRRLDLWIWASIGLMSCRVRPGTYVADFGGRGASALRATIIVASLGLFFVQLGKPHAVLHQLVLQVVLAVVVGSGVNQILVLGEDVLCSRSDQALTLQAQFLRLSHFAILVQLRD